LGSYSADIIFATKANKNTNYNLAFFENLAFLICCRPMVILIKCHSLSLLIRSSSVSAITTRSSAYNNSHGKVMSGRIMWKMEA